MSSFQGNLKLLKKNSGYKEAFGQKIAEISERMTLKGGYYDKLI